MRSFFDDPKLLAMLHAFEAEWFTEQFRMGSYRGERGAKPPGIEVFTIARDAMDGSDTTHMSSPPRIINRHNRRKAAKLNRGK